MQRRKVIIGFVILGVVVSITSYLYWILRFDFDTSGLNKGDSRILVAEILGFKLPPETKIIQEKIKSGFGNDYGVESIFSVPAQFSTTILSACNKYGLAKGETLPEVLAATKMNITQLDSNMVFSQMGKHEPTCYRRQLKINNGEIRVSLVVLTPTHVFLLDSRT